jgi:NAD(P)-dependent dehydrogenase (short-subunit alcohol dehydrogenase family)
MDVDRCMLTLMVALLAPKRLRKAPVKQFLQPSDEEVLGYDEDEIEDDQDSQLDITLDDSINRCFQTIEQNFGKFDILINNAGTAAAIYHLTKGVCASFSTTASPSMSPRLPS